jgi:hypothetical protein
MSDTPRVRTDQDVTEASEDSFPASDPPSFTPTTSSIADRVDTGERRGRGMSWRMLAAVPAAIGGLFYMIRRSRRRTLG